MRTGFEQLCLSHLPQLGLKPAKKGLEEKNGVGFTFVPEPGVGKTDPFVHSKKNLGTSTDLADCNLSLFFTGKALSGGCGGSLCPENFYVIHAGAA